MRRKKSTIKLFESYMVIRELEAYMAQQLESFKTQKRRVVPLVRLEKEEDSLDIDNIPEEQYIHTSKRKKTPVRKKRKKT